jgi:hypothetical protein
MTWALWKIQLDMDVGVDSPTPTTPTNADIDFFGWSLSYPILSSVIRLLAV